MKKTGKEDIDLAQQLMNDFLSRTGISDGSGDVNRRYLWTDAFAVQSCFALSHLLNQRSYHDMALELIDKVHHILGKHRKDDSRKGWISGLGEEEGEKHPTINGLRIGKKLPERPREEVFDQQLEWERDGQYFHYLTRWFNALLVAYEETNETNYAQWAHELIQAGEKFLTTDRKKTGMAWKMNINLTQPVVKSMGAHDPLEALICIYRAGIAVPSERKKLESFRKAAEEICRNMNWFTYDPLGIGGLLLSVKRSCDLEMQGEILPASIRPDYLLAAARAGLKVYVEQVFNSQYSGNNRLAFRECGMLLGVNALYEMKDRYEKAGIDLKSLESFLPLMDEITGFWSESSNRSSQQWNAHQDINAVMFASVLLAKNFPKPF